MTCIIANAPALAGCSVSCTVASDEIGWLPPVKPHTYAPRSALRPTRIFTTFVKVAAPMPTTNVAGRATRSTQLLSSTIVRPSPTAGALERLEEMKKRIAARKQVLELNNSGRTCSKCDMPMKEGDANYICPDCGQVGAPVETIERDVQQQRTSGAPSLYASAGGRFESLSDAFNLTFELTFNRLKLRAIKNPDYHIPLDVLRAVAQEYAEICQKRLIAQRAAAAESMQGNVIGGPEPARSAGSGGERHRHNLIIHGLLQAQLDKRGMSKTDTFLCAFSDIDKSKLTKSKNKLQRFIKAGEVAPVSHDRIPSFVYQFLTSLGVDTQYTDVVVALIRRADRQVDMIRYRTCQDNSKVVGAICILLRQLNIKIPHSVISERCEHISKSTYHRWMVFADIKRRRLNPILVAARIRPIPRSFAASYAPKKHGIITVSRAIGRDAHCLAPLGEKLAGLYIGW